MEGVQEAATAHGGKMQILEGTQCKYPLFSAAPRAGAAGSPGAGTVTRVALLLQSALLNALY